MKTWSRATGFNWENEKYRDIIYQGYEDGYIREWKFDRKSKKFELGYDEWCHLDAIRDIITLPEYDLMISMSRVNIYFYTFNLHKNGGSKIWNQTNKDFYYLLTHHVDAVAQATFSPDHKSRLLATASWDQSVNIYKLPERLFLPDKPEVEFEEELNEHE